MRLRFSEDQRIRSADIRGALADAQELPSFVTRHTEPKKTAFVGKTFVGCEEFRAELCGFDVVDFKWKCREIRVWTLMQCPVSWTNAEVSHRCADQDWSNARCIFAQELRDSAVARTREHVGCWREDAKLTVNKDTEVGTDCDRVRDVMRHDERGGVTRSEDAAE